MKENTRIVTGMMVAWIVQAVSCLFAVDKLVEGRWRRATQAEYITPATVAQKYVGLD